VGAVVGCVNPDLESKGLESKGLESKGLESRVIELENQLQQLRPPSPLR
jgi:hypothetical protein